MANTNFNTLTFLRNYNNYFNRKVKYYDFLADYINQYTYYDIGGINFNPNDGISAEQIINWDQPWMPDYMLLLDSNSNIISRWFVIESKRERTGQYRIILRRDVIADNYQTVLTSPCYIEKGTIPFDSPLIYNSEGSTFNQIKKREYLLKDYTRSSWLVGYVARGESSTIPEKLSITTDRSVDFIWDSDLFPVPGSIKEVRTFSTPPTLRIQHKNNEGLFSTTLSTSYYVFSDDYKTFSSYTYDKDDDNDDTNYFLYFDRTEDMSYVMSKVVDNSFEIGAALKQEYGDFFKSSNDILSYNGKTVAYNTGSGLKTYIISVGQTLLASTYTLPNNAAIGTAIQNSFPADDSRYEKVISGEPFKLRAIENVFYIQLIEYTNAEYKVPMSSTRRILMDAPYDMFCIPYTDSIKFRGDIGEGFTGTLFSNSSYLSLRLAQGIVEKLTNANIYDLQLLPYCPRADLLLEYSDDKTAILDITGLRENEDYNLITRLNPDTEKEYPEAIIFWCSVSNGSFNIPFNYQVSDRKIENECDLWRLCSPNFNGMFDFSMAKNDGLDYFNVDWTYKPYTPYIHINPNFKNLYGGDYNDARGLICGGDFSVATAVSKFAEYEVQNKNYQNIFDRNIQNMDRMRKIEVGEQIVNTVTSTAGSVASGVASGSVAGAVIGGVSNAVNGAANIAFSEARYRENKSYATDQFNFQLGNIQALPMSLTKSSALTYNNKIWPILEYYTATDVEKEALRNKLKYNGMTVMIIDQIKNYIKDEPSFIQGQMIRLENLSDDSHIAYAIYDEIKKGVYI